MKSKYFIIAGTNKAGTTSFFEYLADHPDICPAYIKQTFFFLDREWQNHWGMKSIFDYEKGLDQFDQFFRPSDLGQHKLEATPDYLYAPECPKRIHSFLKEKEGKVIFILREPVKRFISLYYFGKQQGLIPEDMDFKTFRQESESYNNTDNMSLIAYKTGFYSLFVKAYYDHFPKENILIYFFEDLINDPVNYLKQVAVDLEIDPAFYDSYDFKSYNTTVKIRSRRMEDAYNGMRSALIHSVYKTKLGYAFINALKAIIKPVYNRLNSSPLIKEDIPEAEIQYLEEVYAREAEDLAKLTGLDIPWGIKTPI